MKSLKVIVLSCVALVLATGCSKKKSGGSAAPVAVVSYYMSNNICFDAKTNEQVASTNCANLAYYFNGTQCVDQTTKQAVEISKCHSLVGQYYYMNNTCWDKNTNTSTAYTNCNTNSNAGSCGSYTWRNNICIDTRTGWVASSQNCLSCANSGNQCIGNYIYVDYYGYSYSVTCNGSNCRGQGLYEANSGRYVVCQ